MSNIFSTSKYFKTKEQQKEFHKYIPHMKYITIVCIFFKKRQDLVSLKMILNICDDLICQFFLLSSILILEVKFLHLNLKETSGGYYLLLYCTHSTQNSIINNKFHILLWLSISFCPLYYKNRTTCSDLALSNNEILDTFPKRMP